METVVYAFGLTMIPPQFAQGTLRSVMLFPFSDYNKLTFDKLAEALSHLPAAE